MVRRAASNMRKDLTCTKVLEIIMQPDPSSELQYVLSQFTDYNRCKGSVENLHQVCAITHLFLHTSYSQSQSPAAVPPDTNPQTAAGTSSSGVKRGTCKKNTQLLHLLWWTHLQRAPSDMLKVLLERLNTHTPTPPPPHTHTQTHTKYLE